MSRNQLTGARVLVIEDEYLLADDARTALIDLGAEVLGPVPTAQEASEVIASHPRIDAALLDINLRGRKAFDVADLLQARGIPFAFVTGYDRESLPQRFSDAISLQKPLRPEQLTDLFGQLRPTVAT